MGIYKEETLIVKNVHNISIVQNITSHVFRLPILLTYIESMTGAQINFIENGTDTIENKDKLE